MVPWDLLLDMNSLMALMIEVYMYLHIPYYKTMGDLAYICSEHGGLIIHAKLIYEFQHI